MRALALAVRRENTVGAPTSIGRRCGPDRRAWTYLRRIFEDLVDEVAQPAFTNGDFSKEQYVRSRMDKKWAC